MSKIDDIQRTYGKDKCNASLEECADYLKSIGYDSLAELLLPLVKVKESDV